MQHITLHLDAHHVNLRVPVEQEAAYREAAELLNDRFKHHLNKLPNASAEQLWMYTALEMAVSFRSDARVKSLEPVEKALKMLNEQVLGALNG
ncbi:MAG: cell division protein ZapA [Paludibacteraceae bacterium]|nr:cell division protein ZapA [Paludibacteraceae bacterium]